MDRNTINNDATIGGEGATLLAGRYRIERQLGQGGMGSVWLAEDTQLDNRQVAIKMLPSILVSNRRAYSQLKAEALVSLKLTHPNIAAVRAFEENGGNPFLVVDYIDGQTLDDYLAEKCDAGREASMRPPLDDGRAGAPRTPQPGGLPEADVIRLLTPIASALDYAHGEGVVHRDVKPGNVMIRTDGHPFILDFGISREIQETMTRVTGKLSSGTLMYMSPEQLNGDAPNPAQDVYSFAAMAYECLTGAPPFVRGAIEDQIKNKAPAPLGPHFMKCGQGVMAGLAKRPEERPITCASVLTSDGAASRRPPNVVGRARIPSAPHRSVVTIISLLLLAVVGGAAYVWYQGRQDAISQQATIIRLSEEKKKLAERMEELESEKTAAEAKRVREEQESSETAQKEKEKQRAEEDRIAKEKESALTEARSARLVAVIDAGTGRREVKADFFLNDKRFTTPFLWEKLKKGNCIPSVFASYFDKDVRYEGTSLKATIDWEGAKDIVLTLHEYDIPFYISDFNVEDKVTLGFKGAKNVATVEVSKGELIARSGYKLVEYARKNWTSNYFNEKVYNKEGVAIIERVDDGLLIQCSCHIRYRERDVTTNRCEQLLQNLPILDTTGTACAKKHVQEEDWKDLLRRGYMASNKSSLDRDEYQRNISLIKKRFDWAWKQAGIPSGSFYLGAMLLRLKLGDGGKVLSYELTQSSGYAGVDATVLDAAKLMGSIDGLSPKFVQENNGSILLRIKILSTY